MYYKLNQVLDDIDYHITNKIPFSIIRLGDGDISILKELVSGEFNSKRSKREGYKKKDKDDILSIYRESCNNANYVSGFEMFLNNKMFWRSANPPKMITPECANDVRDWKNIYKVSGITNTNFIHPDLGWQMFLQEAQNLFHIIKGHRICLITCFPKAVKVLENKKGIKANIIIIPGRFKNHYSSHTRIKKEIKQMSKKYDVFLVGGGAVGRGYSNHVKKMGKVAIDIGKIFDMWVGKTWIKVYRKWVIPHKQTLDFSLTPEGQKFRKYL